MSDELDMAYDRNSCVMGSTDCHRRSRADRAVRMRFKPTGGRCGASAEARRVLLEMAEARFAVPVDQLVISEGVISIKADSSRKVTYGELIGGRRFNVALTGNNADATTGVAKIKAVQDLKIVGQSPQRYDIPAKVDGSLKWAVDMKVPGMVHARNVKPPFAGAKLISIDEASVKTIPGFIRVVSKGNYVAVVCEREEQAIRAARQLKVDWQKPATAPSRHRKVCTIHARRDPQPRAVRRPWLGIPTRRCQARQRSSRPNTTFRSRAIRPSARLMPWPIPRTIS